MNRAAASFYRFVAVDDPEALRAAAAAEAGRQDLLGTLLVASEGLNGTLVGGRGQLEAFLDWLQADPRLAGLPVRWSGVPGDATPFRRLKVKVKAEIVSFGMPGFDPAAACGRRADAQRWRALLEDPEVTVLDTRNRYETAVGAFAGALRPDIDSFRELPAWVAAHLDPQRTPRVAMYCTGGIRCEKASAWLAEQGFAEVWQLDGGILGWLDSAGEDDPHWQGDCFVFDHRVALERSLDAGDWASCPVCRHPLAAEDRRHPDMVPGEQCPHCVDAYTPAQRAAAAERYRQQQLAEARGATHVGARMPTPDADCG